MSINRFLSRRDKRGPNRQEVKNHLPEDDFFFNGLFIDTEQGAKRQAKYHGQQFKDAKALLAKRKVTGFTNDDIQYALNLPFTDNSTEKTAELFKLIQDSESLKIRPCLPNTKYLGCVNRDGVSCWLDSLLFAMFAHSDSFEMMLSSKFDDPWKNRLASLIRLWVNAQRSGNLVTVDVIQETLAICGWTDARETRQQDVLEAYSFILEQLGFPDLHLRMDIFHSGKEDANDDHKIVHERVLAMPIPEPREDGVSIKLEDCFELALIAKIDVRRKYEERRATMGSTKTTPLPDHIKSQAIHVESVELSGSEVATPVAEFAPTHDFPRLSTHRAPSLIQDKIVYDKELSVGEERSTEVMTEKQDPRPRAGSVRKEVMMPAWQMYSLIPFHSDCTPNNDAEVAAHITSKQPVFCIALKRYGFGKDGNATRRDDYVDIPLDMALPHFIQEEDIVGSTSRFDKFKISLQALVCHRGKSVAAGHYISLARIALENEPDKWALHDDLAQERVREVDIHECLRKETPYLLFYRVQPLDVPILRGITTQSRSSSITKDSGIAGISSMSLEADRSSSEKQSSQRPSFESPSLRGSELGSVKGSVKKPSSIALTDNSVLVDERIDLPAEKPSEGLAVKSTNSSRRSSNFFGVGSKSQPISRAGSKRSSISLSRFTDLLSNRSDLEIAKLPAEQIRETLMIASKTAGSNTADAAPDGRNKETSKREKPEKKNDEKRKNRYSAHGLFERAIGDEKRPDRECSVM